MRETIDWFRGRFVTRRTKSTCTPRASVGDTGLSSRSVAAPNKNVRARGLVPSRLYGRVTPSLFIEANRRGILCHRFNRFDGGAVGYAPFIESTVKCSSLITMGEARDPPDRRRDGRARRSARPRGWPQMPIAVCSHTSASISSSRRRCCASRAPSTAARSRRSSSARISPPRPPD